MENANKKEIVAYIRVSNKNGDVDRQINDIISYTNKNNMTISKIFVEKVSAFGKLSIQKQLLNAILYSSKNNIHTIIITEPSRLTRRVDNYDEIIKISDKNHIYFQSILFDVNTIKNLKKFRTFIEIAENEVDCIKYRLNSGRKLAIERGVKMGRKVGSVKTIEQMREQYKEVIKCLEKGNTIADTFAICKAKDVKCSISTIKRVKKVFHIHKLKK